MRKKRLCKMIIIASIIMTLSTGVIAIAHEDPPPQGEPKATSTWSCFKR